MGVVNVTPDSFSDGGQFTSTEEAIAHGLRLVSEGARIVDIGGESTRPGAEPVSAREQIERTAGVIRGIRERSDCLISIDTTLQPVAASALDAGADIINDISGGMGDEAMLPFLAQNDSGYVMMHMQGNPATMQLNPSYADPVKEIHSFFSERLSVMDSQGIERERVVLDPGIGFGKTLHHNLMIMDQLANFFDFERPVLIGASRKSFINAVSPAPVSLRLGGSIAAALQSATRGAHILRVHDVLATRQALDIFAAIAHPEDYI